MDLRRRHETGVGPNKGWAMGGLLRQLRSDRIQTSEQSARAPDAVEGVDAGELMVDTVLGQPECPRDFRTGLHRGVPVNQQVEDPSLSRG